MKTTSKATRRTCTSFGGHCDNLATVEMRQPSGAKEYLCAKCANDFREYLQTLDLQAVGQTFYEQVKSSDWWID